jgi:hypothetical protein
MILFTGQSLITIKLDTGIDVSGATMKRMLYKKPSGVKGYFPVTSVEGTTKLVVSNLSPADLNEQGPWEMQAYVEIGGLKGYGKIIKQEVQLALAPQ